MSGKNQRRPEGYVTRAEFARAAKKGKTTIRRWEAEGKLKPIIGPGGVRLFRVEDVTRLTGAESLEPLSRARAYVPTADSADGAIGAAVFERLLQGMPPVKIVTDLKNVHPDIIAGFIARYERMSGGMFFNEKQRYTLCASLQIRRDADAATIYRRVMEVLQERTCRSCQEAVAHYCEVCVEAYERKAAEAAAQRRAEQHAAAERMAAQQAAKARRNDRQRSPGRDDGFYETFMHDHVAASPPYDQENEDRRPTPPTRQAGVGAKIASETPAESMGARSEANASSAETTPAKVHPPPAAHPGTEERGRYWNELQQLSVNGTPEEIRRWFATLQERLQPHATRASSVSSGAEPSKTLMPSLEPTTRNSHGSAPDDCEPVGDVPQNILDVRAGAAFTDAASNGATHPATSAAERPVPNDSAPSHDGTLGVAPARRA